MKGYVITLLDDPRSVKIAKRCIASGKEHGFEIDVWPATGPHQVHDELEDHGLTRGKWETKWSSPDAVLANFLSQYRVWTHIAAGTEPGAVFEHDAVVHAPLPSVTLPPILQVGRPSFGRYQTTPLKGVLPFYSGPRGYVLGAHAYILTPTGAKSLLSVAKAHGAQPVDAFLSLTHFPTLQELSPWIAHVEETFSTIQHQAGCRAKHMYGPGYRHLS